MKKVKKQIKIPRCLNCGKRMTPVFDTVAKKFTGYLWRCEKCMSKGKVISIG